MAPTLVLVEGDSDAAAVRAAASLLGLDLEAREIEVVAAQGVTNYPRLLVAFVRAHPEARIFGMYDAADEPHARRALHRAGIAIGEEDSLEPSGFLACEADLEDELIRALGAEAVLRVLEGEGDLGSFRRFQAMPEYRGAPVHVQLHRFLGTRATRKVRCARRLVEALDPDRLPGPLARLLSRLVE